MSRLATLTRTYALDVLTVAGVISIAYGLGQAPAPWGAMLAPVVLGLGILAAVRFGSR